MTYQKFPRSTMNSMDCIPCIIGKMHKALIRGLQKALPTPTEIHDHLSGPFEESFNKNKYFVQLLDARTALSEAHALPTKGPVSILAEGFNAKNNNIFSKDGSSFSVIQADNANEDFRKDLHNCCMKNGIHIEVSPPYAPESNGVANHLVREH